MSRFVGVAQYLTPFLPEVRFLGNRWFAWRASLNEIGVKHEGN